MEKVKRIHFMENGEHMIAKRFNGVPGYYVYDADGNFVDIRESLNWETIFHPITGHEFIELAVSVLICTVLGCILIAFSPLLIVEAIVTSIIYGGVENAGEAVEEKTGIAIQTYSFAYLIAWGEMIVEKVKN